MNELQERFTTALHTTARAWRQALDRRLKYLGLSQASWLTIAVAARFRNPSWPIAWPSRAQRWLR
jgi:MarR family transcriptional regulator for hemolysin